jgi:hypothetical protein
MTSLRVTAVEIDPRLSRLSIELVPLARGQERNEEFLEARFGGLDALDVGVEEEEVTHFAVPAALLVGGERGFAGVFHGTGAR